MSADIKALPEGFLGKILGSYGLQWTHLAIISGVVFSSFGLERYLNPGIWVLGVVFAFGVVVLFEPEISPRFPLVALAAAVVGATALALPAIVLRLGHHSVGTYLERHTAEGTLFIACTIGVPLGIAILSYRKRPDVLLHPLSESMGETVKETVLRASFINETVDYSFELVPHHDASGEPQIVLRYELTFNVWNRSKLPQRYSDLFDPAGLDKRFYYAAINRVVQDHDSPELRSKIGLRLEHDAAPGERFQVIVRAESTFGVPGSELIGSYLPSNNMIIRIQSPPPGIRIFTQSLTSVPLDKQILPTGDTIIAAGRPMLPYQGIRLFWDSDASSPVPLKRPHGAGLADVR